MPSAEIITIGTEILLGEIQDTNTRYLARNLRDLGVDLFRTSTVGDNEERIANLIRECLSRSQIVITTGGLGPTVDDPTRQAVARAMGVKAVFSEELWKQVEDRFVRFGRPASNNNRRQAYIPEGAIPVENPVGTAPAFICETAEGCVISLPGVPREMEFLYHNAVVPYLQKRYNLTGIILARVLHVSGMGESSVDAILEDLETSSNPTVGLLAHPGQVDVRITAKAESQSAALRMIEDMENEIRKRLGAQIYGVDGESLESRLKAALADTVLSLDEQGTGGELNRRLLQAGIQVQLIPDGLQNPERAGLRLRLSPQESKLRLELTWCDGQKHLAEDVRYYGGPQQHGPLWAANSALDFLLKHIQQAN